MDDEPHESQPPSRFARITRDPLQTRHWARIAALVVTLLSGIGWAVLDGAARSLLLALGWIAFFPIAAGLGIGDGFFIEHGRGLRRAIVTIIAGTFVALLGCVLLSAVFEDGDEGLGRAIAGSVYALLYTAMLLVFGGILGIAFGKGGGYLARRIQQVDDEGW